jgi:dinuclear metal center YbgI/SA1388 family protein
MEESSYSVRQICTFLEELAPVGTAESWDNVGLMLGDPDLRTNEVVLSLDADRRAFSRCIEEKAALLITHHPLFFHPLRSIDYQTPKGSLLRDLIQSNITVYSAHTNLDKAEHGVNFALAQAVGLTDTEAVEGAEIGLAGKLKRQSLYVLADILRRTLGASQVVTNGDTDGIIESVFVCGGSFDAGSIDLLSKRSVDLIITGEIGYHDMTDLYDLGIRTIALGHDVSERVVLDPLADILRKKFPGLGVAVARGFDYNRNVF